MSRRTWVTFTHQNADGTWGATIERRLTGRLGRPSTGERRELVGADGEPASFHAAEAARQAVDAAEKTDGPWGPVMLWRTI